MHHGKSKQQQVIRIFFQDIEEAVVIKQTKNTTFKRNGEGRG
jgi:hypothetical protein